MQHTIATSVATATLAIGLSTAPVTASPLDRFSDIYVFGDSLSDPGNLFEAIYGVPGSPLFPVYPAGQFTDGDTWASQIGADLASGRNFAHGAARAAETGDISFDEFPTQPVFNVPDFADQIALFRDSGPTLGHNPLAAVWFGGNDLLGLDGSTTIEAVFAAAFNAIGTGLLALANEGFTNFAVFGLPDLGQIPRVQSAGSDAMTSATLASIGFNANLQILLSNLPLAAEVTYVDTFDVFNDILGDPGAFGFTDTENPCLGALLIGAVADCTTFVFYDDLHPTAATHALIADRFTSALSPIPLPAGFVFMLSVAGVLGLLRRRRTGLA